MSNDSVLLYSGGLDSMCIYQLIKSRGYGKNVQGFHISHDLEYEYAEREAVKEAINKYGMDIREAKIPLMYLGPYEDEASGFIPLRNLLFTAIPAMEGASTIYLGAVAGEYSLDKSQEFYKKTSELFSYLLGRDIYIAAPYQHLTKTQLVRNALEKGVVTEEMLRSTKSCYHHVDRDGYNPIGCGKCMACVRRWIAMIDNGIEEEYREHPSLYFEKMLADTGIVFSMFKEQPRERWREIVRNNMHAWRVYRKHRTKK